MSRTDTQTGENEGLWPVSSLLNGNLTGRRTVQAPGGNVELTNLDKVYWPDDGYTKGDLIRYYHAVSDTILPYLTGRPLILKRFPNGIAQGSFFQHEAGDVPEYVHTARLETEEGREIDYILCDNEATLLYLSNLGTIERHTWHVRIETINCPDWMVFDLDPGKGVTFKRICELALAVREVLDRLGLSAYPKTSGSRGMHVYVPIASRYPFDVVAKLAAHVAEIITSENTSLATVERSLDKREHGQIYVDHLQNAYGKSVVAPYSVRPRPGATVSMPVTWEEVTSGVDPAEFNINTVPDLVAKRGDLFRPVLEHKQKLENTLKAAGIES